MQSTVIVSLDKDLFSLVESVDRFKVLGFLDANNEARDTRINNLGNDQAWTTLKQNHPQLTAILAIDPPLLRKKLVRHYGLENLLTLLSPYAQVDDTAIIGDGSIIQHGVTLSRDVKVGTACKINMNCALHHDVKIGNYCTIAPSATLLGNVQLADECYIGAGAIILPNLTLAPGVTVGAGAVVTKSIDEKKTVVGIPAAPL